MRLIAENQKGGLIMKKVATLLAAVAVSLLLTSLCFAQAEGKVGQKATIGSDHLKADMSALMNDMSAMMAKMSGMMKDMNPDKMKMMAGPMKEMSTEMLQMSDMLNKGMISDRVLEKMYVRMMKAKQRLSDIEKK
jgi:hypothetical protein